MSKKLPPREVEKEAIFKEFCDNRRLAPRTITSYANSLQKYSDFTGKTLEELIEEAEKEEDGQIRYRKRKINHYLNKFQQHIEGYSYNYQQNLMTSIKAFYNEYDIQLPRSKRSKSRRYREPEEIGDLPTIEEIQRFIEYCNTTYKLIVVLGLSSGMSRAELSSLTFRHFYDSIPLEKYPKDIPELIRKLKKKGDFVPLWNVIRVKTGKSYFTFSSPESVDRMITYLEELHLKNPDFKPKPEDMLLRNTSSNKHIHGDNIGSIFPYINRVNGFRSVNGRYVIRSHTLRKYFATTLEKNKIPYLTTKWLLGHTVDKTNSAYFKADPEALREDYLTVVDQLTTDAVQVKVIDRYEEIKHEIDTIKDDMGLVISKGHVPKDILEYIAELEALLDKYQNKEHSEEETLYDDAEI